MNFEHWSLIQWFLFVSGAILATQATKVIICDYRLNRLHGKIFLVLDCSDISERNGEGEKLFFIRLKQVESRKIIERIMSKKLTQGSYYIGTKHYDRLIFNPSDYEWKGSP